MYLLYPYWRKLIWNFIADGEQTKKTEIDFEDHWSVESLRRDIFDDPGIAYLFFAQIKYPQGGHGVPVNCPSRMPLEQDTIAFLQGL